MKIYVASIFLLLLFNGQKALADRSPAAMQEIFVKLANPVSDLAALPIQYNFNFKDNDSSRSTFNFQPFFPTGTDQITVVNRFIAPFVETKTTTETGTTTSMGFGDFNYQFYVTPKQTSALGVTLAAGALIAVPTGMDPTISSGKWGAGPSAAIISSTDDWSLGAVIYQNWSFAGDKDRKDVNLLTIQPICTYRLGNLWSLVPINNITYDANLEGQKWTVPLGLQVTKLLPREDLPFNIMLGFFSNVIRPEQGPEWSMKFQMTMVL